MVSASWSFKGCVRLSFGAPLPSNTSHGLDVDCLRTCRSPLKQWRRSAGHRRRHSNAYCSVTSLRRLAASIDDRRTAESARRTRVMGEWRGGISPPRSLRTGRVRLRASGSHFSKPLRHRTKAPVRVTVAARQECAKMRVAVIFIAATISPDYVRIRCVLSSRPEGKAATEWPGGHEHGAAHQSPSKLHSDCTSWALRPSFLKRQ